jgi:hypothetical protein
MASVWPERPIGLVEEMLFVRHMLGALDRDNMVKAPGLEAVVEPIPRLSCLSPIERSNGPNETTSFMVASCSISISPEGLRQELYSPFKHAGGRRLPLNHPFETHPAQSPVAPLSPSPAVIGPVRPGSARGSLGKPPQPAGSAGRSCPPAVYADDGVMPLSRDYHSQMFSRKLNHGQPGQPRQDCNLDARAGRH